MSPFEGGYLAVDIQSDHLLGDLTLTSGASSSIEHTS
jgi:hypothetical protein